jgi:hypothetical protein
MVTHGYVVFKYEGIYYIYDNHSDSYCEALGKEVVNEIDIMINKNYIKYYKKKLLSIPLIREMSEGGGGISQFYSFYNAIYYPDSCSYYTSKYEPSNSYVYVIDFDEEEFIINKYDNRYTFNLFDIPDNWMEIVETSENYMYDNIEEVKNEKIKAKISELEDEINKLKLKLKLTNKD